MYNNFGTVEVSTNPDVNIEQTEVKVFYNQSKILGHLSDTDLCPTTEISFSDKRPCRTRIRKRTFVRKSVTIIFKIMLETMVYNVWVTGCSTVRCINVCLLV